jgi:hypothetical protein
MINANQLINDLFPIELVNGMRDKAFFLNILEVYSQRPALLATFPTLDEIYKVCQEIINKI